jgi:hypothetical protein
MKRPADIVVAEVPCITCGYNLLMQPANGRCPECGTSVGDTLRNPLLTAGRTRVRKIAFALTFSDGLNVLLLGTEAVISIGYPSRAQDLPFLCLLAVAFFCYAVLQTGAMALAATLPGDQFAARQRALALYGGGMALLSVVFWGMLSASHLRYSAALVGSLFLLWEIAFISLVIFTWLAAQTQVWLCSAGCIRGMVPWGRRIGLYMTVVVITLALGFLVIPALTLIANAGPEIVDLFVILIRLGIFLTAPGLLGAAIFQFLLARRLRILAASIPSPLILTGPPSVAMTQPTL